MTNSLASLQEVFQPRILVADDEPHIGRIIDLKLRQQGYPGIDIALDGNAAWEHLRAVAYDLVLLDIMMPHRTGLELLEEMRSEPSLREIPVIILTAKGLEADRKRSFELGATDFFTKPFSPKRLGARIDALLGRTPTPAGIAPYAARVPVSL